MSTVKSGGIYSVGGHVIGCGSSLDTAFVSQVIGDQKIQAIVTDPPYGVEGKMEDSRWRNMLHMIRRYRSDEIPFTDINLILGDEVRSVTTDAHGYFHFRWNIENKHNIQEPWTQLVLQPTAPKLPKAQENSVAEVSLPGEFTTF